MTLPNASDQPLNSGSGNQGIAATMPVVAAAMVVKASEEQLIRAVTLSHIVAIYIKSHQNSLSALCAANTAAMGSGAAITWLLGGDDTAIACCIQNMIGDVAGIICDGAKASCAMKVSAAVNAALLARNYICFLLMYPAYSWLADEPTIAKLLIVQLAISVVSGLFLGIYCTTVSEMLPARIRSTGLSIANTIAVLVFGGFAQFTLTWTYKITGSQIAPVYYVMFGIAAGVLGAVFIPARAGATGPARAGAGPLSPAPAFERKGA